VERRMGLNPLSPDSNNNGIPDGEEDTDGDGFSNCAEILQGTDPNSRDTDKDGLSDRDEILRYFTDPANPDTDGDGMNDGDEVARGTDPFNADTDGDGFDDNTEVLEGMDPLVADPPLMRSVSSRPMSFMAAGREDLPIQVQVTAISRLASYGNLQTVRLPESLPITVASTTPSYFNALTVPGADREFIVSGVASYRRNLPVSASVEPDRANGSGGALVLLQDPVVRPPISASNNK